MTTVVVPFVQGVVACNRLGSKMDLAAFTSAEVWTRTLPFWRLDPHMAPLEHFKWDYTILAARLIEGVTVRKGDLVRSQHYSGKPALR